MFVSRVFALLQVGKSHLKPDLFIPLVQRFQRRSNLLPFKSTKNVHFQCRQTQSRKSLIALNESGSSREYSLCSALFTENPQPGQNAARVVEREHPDCRTIFVGRLNFQTTEETLEKHFSKFGAVENVRLLLNAESNHSLGYAFVIFEDVATAEKVLEEKHCVDLRWLQPQMYKRSSFNEKKVYVKNVPVDMDTGLVRNHFSQFGAVKSIDFTYEHNQNRKDFCFVEFSSTDGVLSALQQESQQINGQPIKVCKSFARKKSFVPGKVLVDLLPKEITVEDLKSHFEKFCTLHAIDMVFYRKQEPAKNFAFLTCQSDDQVNFIISEVSEHVLLGQKVVVKRGTSVTQPRVISRDKKIFVEGIPLDKTKEDALEYFSKFGEVLHVYFVENWAERHGTQCGIVRLNQKSDIDNILAHKEHTMDNFPLRIRRLGWSARASPSFTPFYTEFSNKHRNTTGRRKENLSPDKEMGTTERQTSLSYPSF